VGNAGIAGGRPPKLQDKDLYQHILGLTSPWTVRNVNLETENQEIRIQVDHPRGTKFCCPECQQELSCYDNGEERQWRHLDSCQFKTLLVARVPRVACPQHGDHSVNVRWAESHSRFTLLVERFAIDVLQMTQTVKGAMTILRLEWDATWHIIERPVARGKARKEPSLLPRIGIDEKAFAKGQSFVSLIYDLDNSTVEAIAMDMNPAYVKANKQCIPLAEEKIVHDPFHVMKFSKELSTRCANKNTNAF